MQNAVETARVLLWAPFSVLLLLLYWSVTALHYSCCSASGSHRDRGDVVHLLYVGHSAMACCWKTLVDQLHGVGGDDPAVRGPGELRPL